MLDLTKRLVTRKDRYPVRYLGEVKNGGDKLIFAIEYNNGTEGYVQRYKSGAYRECEYDDFDIVYAPEVSEAFMNIYKNGGQAMYTYETLEAAKSAAVKTAYEAPVAHIKLTMTDGVPTKVELV